MKDPTGSRSARLHDAKHLLHLTGLYPCLPFPSVSEGVASFRYTDETDAEAAAEAVMTAEGILSRQLGVEFKGTYTEPTGSMEHYQRTAKLGSGLYVIITAQAAVGPLVDARQDAEATVPVAA